MSEHALCLDATDSFRILIVDDQQAQLKSIQMVLMVNGYQDVELAASGDEAISKLQSDCYHLLLLDLQMPGMNGLRVLEYLNQVGNNTEIIVLSGESSFEWVKESMRLGAGDYIRKPYQPTELLNAIANAREKYNEKQQLQKKQRDINYLAYHDLLTGLPNRALFIDRVNQAIARAQRHDQQFALLFIDMDRFKTINDTYGHLVGDRVLQLVANRILTCLRGEDTLCRFGGDEFALLLPDIADQHGIATVARKILAAIRKPFPVDQHRLQLGASLGVAVYPTTGTSWETLLHNADLAMYHVKSTDKDSFSFYTDIMKEGSTCNAAADDLRRALEDHQFEVFYQPQVDPRSRAIVGLEALLRRHHPRRGIIYPEEFLSSAEKSNLMQNIGTLVLRRTCEMLLHWRSAGVPTLTLTLNVSPTQLQHNNFVADFLQTLQEFNLSPALFNLEITEESLLTGQPLIENKIKSLRGRGTSITIDDFGRGFLPLNYLESVPVSALKIDRSFVREISRTARSSRLIDGIAMMAKGMKLKLAATGVENQEQLDYLDHLGCTQVQGYFFSEALPPDQISALLKQGGSGRLPRLFAGRTE